MHLKSVLMLVLVVLSASTLFGWAQSSDGSSAETTSGTTGDCTWVLDGTELTISNGVRSIDSRAVGNCTGLENISFGNGLTGLDTTSFEGSSFHDVGGETPLDNAAANLRSSVFSGTDGTLVKQTSGTLYPYIVNYTDKEGRVLKEPFVSEAEYGSVIVPEIPDIEGYTGPSELCPIAIGTSGNEITYVYTVNSYTVTYKVDGAVTGEVETYECGTEVTVRKDHEMVGHTVTSWVSLDVRVKEGVFTVPAKDITFIAISRINTYPYTVICVDSGGKNLTDPIFGKADYGTTVIQLPPVIEGYTGPSEAVSVVIGESVNEIVLTYQIKSFTVTWLNHDGSVWAVDSFEYGTLPECSRGDPHRDTSYRKDIYFTGWSPEVVPVTSDMTYTAVFYESPYRYVIQWNCNGEVLTDFCYAGTVPEYSGPFPYRASSALHHYVFSGWSPEVVPATADAKYTAVFIEYTYDENGSSSSSSSVSTEEGSMSFSSDAAEDLMASARADEDFTFTANLGDCSVVFDSTAIGSWSDGSASLAICRLSVEDLTDDERSVIGGGTAYNLDFGRNKDFGEGTATVTLTYDLPAGTDPDRLKVWHIQDGEYVEQFDCTYNSGFVTFETSHFSLYAVMYEGPSDGSDHSILHIAGLLIVALAILTAAIVLLRRRA